ncbi:MAG: family 78 glycoside hydrolase catalytic domain [Oscillospiraceae bacterium]|nr:family 78 glycoside hydrolase catalytic domain [Oscillospiraceae bacterium]
MNAVNLKTEYLRSPIGIDIVRPRFGWNCEGGSKQIAYQIIAKVNGETVWNSGKVESSSMTHIFYGGRKLKAKERVNWSVKLWDENGEGGEISHSFFEMGLLEASDWKAKWITGNYKVKKSERYPVDCFRKGISVTKEVKSARLYITACGLYEAKLDGQKIGNFVLAPGHTDYRKRVQYQTYDVTEMLTFGNHALTVQLADGWYRGSIGAWGIRNQYGSETKLLAQMEITYADGSCDTVVTDESWDWSNDGPIRFADNKDGEVVNANRVPSYSGKAKVTNHKVVPTASNSVYVKEHEHFTPTVTKAPNGKTLLNFGQNIAGYIVFKIHARNDQRLTFRLGEMLDVEGNLTQKNIQLTMKDHTTPLQQIVYTCKEGLNEYKTTFAVFGFQYAEVDTDIQLKPEDVTAIAVYSDIVQTGFFESSNDLLNRFVDATIWSTKSNSLDIPTDCPTRERHGWTGDAQIFFETANYLFDYATFSQKYLRDVYDWQMKSGRLPQIAPYGGVDFYMWTMNGSVGWSDAGILIPYRFWKLYGDKQILIDYYDRMKLYAKFMMNRCGKLGLMAKPLGLKGEAKKYAVNLGQSFGEWAEPAEVYPNDWKDMVAPHPEVSTAYTAYVLGCMAEIAEELHYEEDAALFHRYNDGCKKAYQAMAETADYSLDTDRQARLVRPLAFDLLDEKQTEYAQKRLIQALENYGWRLGTGFLSTSLILDVLAQYDLDAAYRLLENEEMPGWLFMPKNGATTIWESWEGTQAQGGIASLNHYSKGAVCEWLFKTMCGIRVDGENHFTIAPKPGGDFAYAKAAYNSVYGKVECSWDKTDAGYRFRITIPCNTTATVNLPDGSIHELVAGNYCF